MNPNMRHEADKILTEIMQNAELIISTISNLWQSYL